MTGIPQILGHGAAGYLMDKEIKYFASVLDNPPRPMVAIVGGAKVSDKILLLENMLTHIDKLIIGGAMAYTFLSAQGLSIGKSYHEAGKSFTDRYVFMFQSLFVSYYFEGMVRRRILMTWR